MPELTTQSLNLLLARLDSDPPEAAEKYEELRLKLARTLIWKGCAESRADALTDAVLDCVAAKLKEGVEIENFNAYVYRVMCFIWLEHRRKNKEDGFEDGTPPEIAVEPTHAEEPDQRLAFLRSCLAKIAKDAEERELLINYYDSDADEKDKNRRKSIAERLGIKPNALKVRMFRLRERLEKCIGECVRRGAANVTD